MAEASPRRRSKKKERTRSSISGETKPGISPRSKRRSSKKKISVAAEGEQPPGNAQADDEANNPVAMELARIRELEQNPTLRWEHAKEDSSEEAERIAAYKTERRARFNAVRDALKAKEAASDQLDSLTLRG